MRNFFLSLAILAGTAVFGARVDAAPVRIEAPQGLAQVQTVQYRRHYGYERPHYRAFGHPGWRRHGFYRPYGYARPYYGRPYYAGPIYRPRY